MQKSQCKERIRVFFTSSNLLHFLPSFIISLFSPKTTKIIYFSIFCCFFSFQLTYISFEVFLCLSALVFCLLLYWYYFWGCWPIWDRCGKRDSKGSDLWSLQTCERERRQREHEAKMERQRQIEADRNKKALDRALAPPYVKVTPFGSKCDLSFESISVYLLALSEDPSRFQSGQLWSLAGEEKIWETRSNGSKGLWLWWFWWLKNSRCAIKWQCIYTVDGYH